MMTRLERQIALSIGLFFLGLFLIWGAVFSYNRCAYTYAPSKVDGTNVDVAWECGEVKLLDSLLSLLK